MDNPESGWLVPDSGRLAPSALSTGSPAIGPRAYVRSSHPGDEGVPLNEYLAVVGKRWRMIACFTAAGFVLAALFCVLARPLYTATSVLHIENVPPQVTTNIQQVVGPPTYLEGWEFFQDQIQLLQSRTLAADVIRDLELQNDDRFTGRNEKPSLLAQFQWQLSSLLTRVIEMVKPARTAGDFGSGPGAEGTAVPDPDVPPALVSRYRGWMEATPVTNSRMIRLSFTTPYPDLSQRLATAHAQQYIRRNLQTKFELTGEARGFLDTEIRRVEGELARSEAALNEFRRENNVVSLDEKENAIAERLTDLSRRLTQAEATRISAEAEYQLIKQREYDSLPAVIANPLIQTLKTEVTRLELRAAEQGEFFLPASPQLQEIQSQLRQARARLAREIDRVVGGIETVFLAAQANEQALRKELQDQQEKVLDLKEVSGQYIKLDQAVTANRNLYGALLTRLKETDVVKGVQLSNASVVDPGELPTFPAYPNIPIALAFGLILGGALGVTMAFLSEHLDTSVKTPDDVRHTLDLPTLGVVPHFDSLPRSLKKPGVAPQRRGSGAVALPKAEVVTLLQDRSLSAEAYRNIRTSLLFANAEQPPKLLLFTSSQAGEGKTSTAVNVAISLSQLGNRVVIIDADLRQPRCHWVLGLAAQRGLVDVLRGQATLAEVVQRIRLSSGEVTIAAAAGSACAPGTIDFLQSGRPQADSATLLFSAGMREVLRSLSESYDTVVIDSPPIFPITDASILATMVNGVVLVVRGQRTERQVTRQALERLRFMNANVIGVVLNGVDPRSNDYYRYPYYLPANSVS